MHFLEAAHSAPEFIAHVAASCGAALFGVVGAKATRVPRALMSAKVAAKRRAAAEEALVRRARREELAAGVQLGVNADWNDVGVDEPENRVVRLGSDSLLPQSGTAPFALFDQRLADTDPKQLPNTTRASTSASSSASSNASGSLKRSIPLPTEFLDADELTR